MYAKKLLQFQFALSNLRFQKNKKRVSDPLAASFLQLHLLWHDKNREKSSSIGRVISLSRPICKKNTCQCDFYIYAKDSLQLMTKPSLNVKCFIKCYMIHTVHFMSISFKHHANFNTHETIIWLSCSFGSINTMSYIQKLPKMDGRQLVTLVRISPVC